MGLSMYVRDGDDVELEASDGMGVISDEVG